MMDIATHVGGFSILVGLSVLLSGCGEPEISPAPYIPPQIITSCSGPDCPPCGSTRTRCAPEGELIEDTCCAAGDALVHVATGGASEAVHIVVDAEHAVLCGGFGAAVNDVRDVTAPTTIGYASGRCQHAAFARAGGEKFLYVTHHGDSWIPSPHLSAFRLPNLEPVIELNEPGVLYEGIAVADDFLYVAAHGGGLRTYRIGEDGVA